MAGNTSGTATTTAERAMTPEGAGGKTEGPRTAGLRAQDGGITVPVLTLGVRRVHLPAPGGVMAVAMNGAAGVSDAVRDRIRMPDTQTVLYYGGLGAMAALGVLSWPAAAAIGAGVWVAERARAAGRQAMGGEPAVRRPEAAQAEDVSSRPAAGGGPADMPPAAADSERATRRREPLP